MHPGLYCQRRQLAVEVVRDRAQHRVHFSHLGQHHFAVTDIDRDRDQSRIVRREERRQGRDIEIGEPYLTHSSAAKKIKRAGGTLRAATENEKTHIEREETARAPSWRSEAGGRAGAG